MTGVGPGVSFRALRHADAAAFRYMARGFEVQGVMRGAMKDGGQYFHKDLSILRLAR
jgi:hypothetical protein